MKYLTIILLVFTLNCSAQITEPDYTINPYAAKKPQSTYGTALKTIGLYAASITLDAVGDGLMDSGDKEWGHVCNAASTGILVMTPLVVDIRKQDWGWYAATYILMRMAVFDIIYNLTRRLAWNYHGTTSGWDNLWGALNPPGWAEGLGRFACFSLAITIPLQNIK